MPELMPIGWFTGDHLTDKSATTYDAEVAGRWRRKGWPVTPIYAIPADQVLVSRELLERIAKPRTSIGDVNDGIAAMAELRDLLQR